MSASHADGQDFAPAQPSVSSPLSTSSQQPRGSVVEASHTGSSTADAAPVLHRSVSSASTTAVGGGVSRNGTLKKRNSMRRPGGLSRSSSKRSLKAGSIKGFGDEEGEEPGYNSVFFTPIPTAGSPTDLLANRFQAWRTLLKSIITYFREIQSAYDTRARALHKVQNTLANIVHPSAFMITNGLGEASRILDDYHKRSIAEANKSKGIEEDVIGALSGLRNDLGQKIKEIKSLSGDFKNTVEKDKDATRREVENLKVAIQQAEDGNTTGKNDPYVVRLGVDRAIDRQIDEENYLHRAYLNLESSGRELETIVVGEIQKAYNALAGILKREGDDAYGVVESLRSGPISMPKDQEWYEFISNDPHFVDSSVTIRRAEDIEYPGKHHPAAAEIRSGMLERKSKYLKSYTAGWYILSATHLHEFKSADKIYSQPPVMSLPLAEQRLGSRSEEGASSNKFMLKGKQSGNMHRGHNWVFRAESHDTMLAWYDDIRALTEKTGEDRTAFVRRHARSVSRMSERGTVSSDGLEEDEADHVPFSADAAHLAEHKQLEQRSPRSQTGGRSLSASKTSPVSIDADARTNSTLVRGNSAISPSRLHNNSGADPYRLDGVTSGSNEFLTTPSKRPDIQPAGASAQPQPISASHPQQPPPKIESYSAPQNSTEPSHLPAQPNPTVEVWTPPAVTTPSSEVGLLGLSHAASDSHPPAELERPGQDLRPRPDSLAIVSVHSASSYDTTSELSSATDASALKNPDGNEPGSKQSASEMSPGAARRAREMSISGLHVPGEFHK